MPNTNNISLLGTSGQTSDAKLSLNMDRPRAGLVRSRSDFGAYDGRHHTSLGSRHLAHGPQQRHHHQHHHLSQLDLQHHHQHSAYPSFHSQSFGRNADAGFTRQPLVASSGNTPSPTLRNGSIGATGLSLCDGLNGSIIQSMATPLAELSPLTAVPVPLDVQIPVPAGQSLTSNDQDPDPTTTYNHKNTNNSNNHGSHNVLLGTNAHGGLITTTTRPDPVAPSRMPMSCVDVGIMLTQANPNINPLYIWSEQFMNYRNKQRQRQAVDKQVWPQHVEDAFVDGGLRMITSIDICVGLTLD